MPCKYRSYSPENTINIWSQTKAFLKKENCYSTMISFMAFPLNLPKTLSSQGPLCSFIHNFFQKFFFPFTKIILYYLSFILGIVCIIICFVTLWADTLLWVKILMAQTSLRPLRFQLWWGSVTLHAHIIITCSSGSHFPSAALWFVQLFFVISFTHIPAHTVVCMQFPLKSPSECCKGTQINAGRSSDRSPRTLTYCRSGSYCSFPVT